MAGTKHPDLNPIEQLFSKLKHTMRKATGRTVEAVHEALAEILKTIPPSECQNYLVNAGYKSTSMRNDLTTRASLLDCPHRAVQTVDV